MIARLPGWQKNNNWVLGSSVAAFSFARVALFFFFFSAFYSLPAFANNLSITNVELVDNVPASDTSDIEFDITWANSWNDNENNDAVWVFAKYCTSGCTTNPANWYHATLKTSGINPSGVSRGSGTLLDVIVSADKKGAFIQRTGQGTGTVTTTDVNLVWDYAQDQVSDATAIAANTRIKVFGIEMVYIPQGAYYFGDIADGTALATPFNIEFGGAATSVPGVVGGEDALTFGTTGSFFYYNNSGANDAADGALIYLPPNYPKGYQATYVMKYEITQGQYADFFNTLTANGQTNRDITSATASGKNSDAAVARNTVSWTGAGTDMTTASIDDRACSYLSWLDVAAYLDWAALRPMTEMEFEKAGRGPVYNVALEFAWGSTSVTACAALANDGATNETCSTGGAMVNAASGLTGPTRVGMFAAGTDTRAASGGSYWGVMDLSGNVSEMIVNIGGISAVNVYTSRDFAGSHGDGRLVNISSASYDGNATNPGWPGLSSTVSQGITTAAGSGTKGGAWNTATASPSLLRIANRTAISSQPATRTNTQGGRGARTASA